VTFRRLSPKDPMGGGSIDRSKPIGFYTWTPELQRTWRFYRFLQHEFDTDQLAIPRDVAAVLKDHADLLKQYRAINAFYGRLTNPLICLPVDALIDTSQDVRSLAKQRVASHSAVAVFPPSTSRETELFERLFPDGLPADANLMVTLIRRIRSGEVDLKPSAKHDADGWYQYQVYALETMLLPGRGQEDEKLLLTAEYKKRLVEAFKAMITTRRETHSRNALPVKCAEATLSRGQVSPRLRVEPCATFYLRTARAYAFLQNFLQSTVGRQRLEKLHGLKQGGTREATLDAELGVKLGLVRNLADVGVRVKQADLAREFKVLAGYLFRTLYLKSDGLCFAREHLKAELFKIE